MNEEMNFNPSGQYEDKSTWLLVGGIAEIILGLISLLFAGICALSLLVAPMQGQNQTAASMLPAVAMYFAGANFFFVIGIGSINCKRWARALMLTISSIWLATGILSIVMLVVMYPMIKDLISSSGAPSGVAAIALFIIIAVMAVFFIILPGGFVLLYRNSDVKATCEAMDPVERWTDRCPLPVLAVSILLFGYFMGYLPTAFNDFLIPFFGIMLKGVPGLIVSVITMIVILYSAIGCYKLKPSAWWCAFAVYVLSPLSVALTFFNLDVAEFARLSFSSKEQIQAIERLGDSYMQIMMLSSLISGAALSGYLIYVKKYFNKPVSVDKQGILEQDISDSSPDESQES